MKLELKHIAPYLPYGVHIKHNEGAKLIICGAFKKYNADDFFIYSLLNWDKDVKSTDAKPILRPLSDLTKEIEHNGKKFVPIEKINEVDGEYQIRVEDGVMWFCDSCDLELFEVMRCSALVEKLFDWHFDVFGLIDNGLAIDINTLKPSRL